MSSGRSPSTPRPNAMFAATPPRRISRSSTRNESDTRSSFSAMNWSTNRPGNVIRWSVAIDPVTAIRTATTYNAGPGPPGIRYMPCLLPQAAVNRPPSVERVAAGAGPGRVGVVDREALLLDRVDEVDSGAGQVRGAHLVGDHVHALELGLDVTVDLALVEVELVAQSRAPTRLHSDAKPQVVAAFAGQKAIHLGCRRGGEVDALGCRLVLNRHLG